MNSKCYISLIKKIYINLKKLWVGTYKLRQPVQLIVYKIIEIVYNVISNVNNRNSDNLTILWCKEGCHVVFPSDSCLNNSQ